MTSAKVQLLRSVSALENNLFSENMPLYLRWTLVCPCVAERCGRILVFSNLIQLNHQLLCCYLGSFVKIKMKLVVCIELLYWDLAFHVLTFSLRVVVVVVVIIAGSRHVVLKSVSRPPSVIIGSPTRDYCFLRAGCSGE